MEPEPKTNTDNASRQPVLWAAAGVFLVGVVMGLPSLQGSFLSGDDVHLVLNHVLVNHPSLAHAWQLVTIVHRDLYQPLPMLSFSLDFAILEAFGLTPHTGGADAGAWVFHLTNVLIHALNGVLVYWLVGRLQPRRAAAIVTAVLFLLHPFAAEVVGWLNGRMMLLATLFSLASLIAMDDYLVRRRWPVAVLAVIFLVFAMASKVRVGLPVLIVLLPLARHLWPDRRWWIVWGIGTALTAGFTALNVASTSASEMFQGAEQELHGSGLARTVLVLAWYFQHYLLPINMSPWHPPETLVEWSHPGIPGALLTLVLLAAAAVVSWRWTRLGVLGLLWFGATIASTLPLMPARDVMAADRYVYLPNIGLLWITGVFLVHAVSWLAKRLGSRAVPVVAGGLGAVGAVALCGYTWEVLSYYESNLDKARRIAEVYPDVPGVWEDVGWAHYREGNYVDAIEAGRIDLAKHPQELACEILQLVGMAEFRLGRFEQCIVTLERAIAANPDYGKCYSRLGQVYYETGRYEQAELYFVKAVEIMPEYLPAVQALGHIYRKQGRLDEAVKRYERALEINDFDPVSVTALAEIEMQRGQFGVAIARFERLLGWMPENTVARSNLGVCYANQGRTDDAMQAYREVLRRNPTAVTAGINLAALEADRGNLAPAVFLLEDIVSHNPTNRAALIALHDLLARQSRLSDAARMWAAALKRQPKAPDLMAWYGWTSALAGQWTPARKASQTVLGQKPAQPLALATRVLADLAVSDAESVDRDLTLLLDAPADPPDVINRLLDAVAALGEKSPENPWPYYFAARLLLANGDINGARLAVDQFQQLCNDPGWRQRAAALLASP